MDQQSNNSVSGSFRDPCGYVFNRNGILYRQINNVYKEQYRQLMESGLYDELVSHQLLIPHEEADTIPHYQETAYKIIKPEFIPFISYPYEWCFSQLKDAALTTLNIQIIALKHGMTLKDSSAYNIQFNKGKPIFIDTLSFEKYIEGQPWIAYRQFCQHFLAPLALMSYRDVRLSQLLRIYMDGIPLDMAGSLLPGITYVSFPLLSHIHLHARSQKQYEGKPVNTGKHKLSKLGFIGIIDNLESAVKNMKWQPKGTEWAEYYQDTNYIRAAFEHKKQIVSDFVDSVNPDTVWDMGSNTGIFSRIAADKGINTVSFDNDPAAVEINYLDCKKRQETHLLPLVIDLNNPSSGTGWNNDERLSLKERGKADLVMALALIHHLAVSNNVPFIKIAEFLRSVGNSLIIEFIPKHDSQVQRLLSTREDIFNNYTREDFERAFSRCFKIERSCGITGSERILYLMTSCK